MAEELYMNKSGFKCVRSQLAKTDGRDPVEYEQAKTQAMREGKDLALATKALKVRAPEFTEN